MAGEKNTIQKLKNKKNEIENKVKNKPDFPARACQYLYIIEYQYIKNISQYEFIR